MHYHAFDRYQPGKSLLHRLDPRVKVLITVGFILSNALLPDGAWLSFGLTWGFLLLANMLSTLGVSFTFRRSFIALPFALAAVTVLFIRQGHPLTSFHFLIWNLTITDSGLIRFVSIVIRSWLSVQMAILLVTVTQFPDLIHAFEHLHVPKILTTIVAFLYRYLFVLSDEALRLMRARQARSAAASGRKAGGSFIWQARVTGHMAGQLFLRSYERSDRIYNAMLARGYTGNLRTLNPHHLHAGDWMFALISVFLLLWLQWLGQY